MDIKDKTIKENELEEISDNMEDFLIQHQMRFF